MKTTKRFLALAVFMIALTAMANSGKVVTNDEGNVTITKVNHRIQVSVLNTNEKTYSLKIYNAGNELVYNEDLGNNNSLGKQFDFNNAPKGNYTFVLSTNGGEDFTQVVKAGSRR